jgi:hypothetical protein
VLGPLLDEAGLGADGLVLILPGVLLLLIGLIFVFRPIISHGDRPDQGSVKRKRRT